MSPVLGKQNMTNNVVPDLVVQFADPIVNILQQLSFLGTSTYVFKVPVVDAQIQPIADSLGMQLAVIKYTLSMFLAYPFAALLRMIPNTQLKHFVSMIGGIILVQWVFGSDWIHSFVSSAITYLICMIAPRKYQPKIVFLWVMGYMTASHLYRMYVSYMSGVFDFTGTQMVLTMKLTSFAYNLYDGTHDKDKVFKDPPPTPTTPTPTLSSPTSPKSQPAAAASKDDKIYSARRKFALTKLPNPLEFFGYIYCFSCLMAGPAFEYSDYLRAIDGSAYFNKKENKKTNPSSLLPSLLNLFIGTLALVGHVVLSGQFPLSNTRNLDWIAASPYWYRAVYTYTALFGERLKYYFAWKVAEGSSTLAGFGFQGYDENGKVIGWSGVENIDILGFELAPNTQSLSRAWNKRTQGWLERYTYQRTGNSLLVTYFVSALWHGLYPGFFLFFMSIPLLTNIERETRDRLNPLIVPGYIGTKPETYPNTLTAKAYWVICWINTLLAMNYLVQVFNMSSLEFSLRVWNNFNYVPLMILVAFYFLLLVVPKPKKEKKL